MEVFFKKIMNFFTAFFQQRQGIEKPFQHTDKHRQHEGSGTAQIKTHADSGKEGHKNPQLAMPRPHAQIEKSAGGYEAKEHIRRCRAAPQYPAQRPQEIIEKPKSRAEEQAYHGLRKLGEGIVFHQWKSFAQRLRLGCTSS